VGGEQARAGLGVELPVGQAALGRGERIEQGQGETVGHQHLGRAQALELCLQRVRRALHEAEVAVGEVQPSQPEHAAVEVGRQQQGVAAVVEQRRVGQRAGGDDAADRALHRPLGRPGFADLLGDHDRFAEPDQAREVLLDGVEGHARHADRLAARLAAGGQRDVEQAGGLLGVLEEELVKVAHAVEKQGVGMLLLQPQILLHHRRMGADLGFGEMPSCLHVPLAFRQLRSVSGRQAVGARLAMRPRSCRLRTGRGRIIRSSQALIARRPATLTGSTVTATLSKPKSNFRRRPIRLSFSCA